MLASVGRGLHSFLRGEESWILFAATCRVRRYAVRFAFDPETRFRTFGAPALRFTYYLLPPSSPRQTLSIHPTSNNSLLVVYICVCIETSYPTLAVAQVAKESGEAQKSCKMGATREWILQCEGWPAQVTMRGLSLAWRHIHRRQRQDERGMDGE